MAIFYLVSLFVCVTIISKLQKDLTASLNRRQVLCDALKTSTERLTLYMAMLDNRQEASVLLTKLCHKLAEGKPIVDPEVIDDLGDQLMWLSFRQDGLCEALSDVNAKAAAKMKADGEPSQPQQNSTDSE